MRTITLMLISGITVGCGAVTDSASVFKAEPAVFEGPVSRATCGPGSLPETDLQGRVPIEDTEGGRAAAGYTCNMELVGRERTAPVSWQLAWYEDCAYYNRDFPNNTAGVQSADLGVIVADVSDPANPKRTTALDSPAMLDPHESLSVTEKRGLLGAVAGWDAAGNGPVYFDVYDLTGDCTAPDQTASLPLNIPEGHEGDWSPDGITYYGSSLWASIINAIDVTDAEAPRVVSAFGHELTHGLSISEDGNRAYLATFRTSAAQPAGAAINNGMTVVDVSQIQARAAVPTTTVLGAVYWTDGAASQHSIPVTIGGKPYVIAVDEGGLGMSRIIDISDETNPVIVSKLKLEIHMPDTAEQRAADGGASGFTYNAHYCGVDQRIEPTVLGCSYFWSGLRIFDIRDPYRPREIAYFNPVGTTGTSASARVRFIKERGEVWFTDQRSGFYVVRLTNGVWPFE